MTFKTFVTVLFFAVCLKSTYSLVSIQLDDLAIKNGLPECRLRPRSEASNNMTIWIFEGETLHFPFCLPTPAEVTIKDFIYSNDGWEDNVTFAIDGENFAEYLSTDMSKFGELWNVFERSGDLGKVYLESGPHVLSINVIASDKWGIEYDELILAVGDYLTADDIRCDDEPEPLSTPAPVEYKCAPDDDAPIKNMPPSTPKDRQIDTETDKPVDGSSDKTDDPNQSPADKTTGSYDSSSSKTTGYDSSSDKTTGPYDSSSDKTNEPYDSSSDKTTGPYDSSSDKTTGPYDSSSDKTTRSYDSSHSSTTIKDDGSDDNGYNPDDDGSTNGDDNDNGDGSVYPGSPDRSGSGRGSDKSGGRSKNSGSRGRTNNNGDRSNNKGGRSKNNRDRANNSGGRSRNDPGRSYQNGGRSTSAGEYIPGNSDDSSVVITSPGDDDMTVERVGGVDFCRNGLAHYNILSTQTTQITLSLTTVLSTSFSLPTSLGLSDKPRVMLSTPNSYIQAYPSLSGSSGNDVMWVSMGNKQRVPCSAMQFSSPDHEGNMTSRLIMRNDGSLLLFPEREASSQAVFYPSLAGAGTGQPAVNIASVNMEANGEDIDMTLETEKGNTRLGVNLGATTTGVTFFSGVSVTTSGLLTSMVLPCADKTKMSNAFISADGTEFVSLFDNYWKSIVGNQMQMLMQGD